MHSLMWIQAFLFCPFHCHYKVWHYINPCDNNMNTERSEVVDTSDDNKNDLAQNG